MSALTDADVSRWAFWFVIVTNLEIYNSESRCDWAPPKCLQHCTREEDSYEDDLRRETRRVCRPPSTQRFCCILRGLLHRSSWIEVLLLPDKSHSSYGEYSAFGQRKLFGLLLRSGMPLTSDWLPQQHRRQHSHEQYPNPHSEVERREENVVADLCVGVPDGHCVAGYHNGRGEVHNTAPVVRGIVPGNAEV